ncbi:hypothetical protein [Amycolatopsis sp. CA-230715]|uniref:hypothetical protein n=1 Tax=Amycolatopsis sp. CA-230715 TaxID=2745196 RepID=UPI001C00F3BA|nr:hypothetical protein [Amycolatopsis sp. CA-230715]QWF80113.1 hypothetical protein HUW46_03531 [Amycolatopsis sp. CA-230715]
MVRVATRPRSGAEPDISFADRTGIVAASVPTPRAPLPAERVPGSSRRKHGVLACAALAFVMVGWVAGTVFGGQSETHTTTQLADPSPAIVEAPEAGIAPPRIGPAPVQPAAPAPAPVRVQRQEAPKTTAAAPSSTRKAAPRAEQPRVDAPPPAPKRHDPVGEAFDQMTRPFLDTAKSVWDGFMGGNDRARATDIRARDGR